MDASIQKIKGGGGHSAKKLPHSIGSRSDLAVFLARPLGLPRREARRLAPSKDIQARRPQDPARGQRERPGRPCRGYGPG
ncbi:MAG: hypothetical protein MZV70_70960 [Desulfobacterales bacterium]|nr:hypothetical protein [Desulfobacterales bacterium]